MLKYSQRRFEWFMLHTICDMSYGRLFSTFSFSCQKWIVKIRSFVDVDGRIIFTEFYKIGINKSGLMKFHVDNRQSISELVNLEPDGWVWSVYRIQDFGFFNIQGRLWRCSTLYANMSDNLNVKLTFVPNISF